VYWEYRIAGISHRVIVNCKRYSKAVQGNDVYTMQGVLADFPGATGVIVTTVGFQSGAIEFATEHRIGLKIIRPANEADYAGRVREIIVDVDHIEKDIIFVEFALDHPWIEKNIPNPAALTQGLNSCNPSHVWINDLHKGERVTIQDLLDRLSIKFDLGVEHNQSFEWDNAMLEYPPLPEIKVCAVKIKYKLRIAESRVVHLGPSVGDMLVKDAIAGTLLFVDKEGEITGDTKEEFGQE
jgi:hypothetical protein